ncbi:oxidoreductase [Planctomyces bekefii]|uniref:Oxidoreductase n=1 Tax=Planctomyces bekefii TaxID=1653850 RepID=A0A5C6M3W3_9PLAN|nr:oxidoreductase [Planctomyces bekefii]
MDRLLYKDQVIALTGTSRGIGKMLAQDLVERGAIVLGFSRSEGTINHPQYQHFAVDISEEKPVETIFRSIKKQCGKIDILINNAGVAKSQFTLLTPLAHAEEVMRINFLGAFLMAREAGKIMMSRKFGRIINISSMTVPLAPEGGAIYSASKSALTQLTHTMAKELASYNITCNLLGISAIETEMYQTLSRDKLDAMINSLPLKKPATIADITNVIDFFARRESSNITSQIVYLGGVY